MEYRLKAVATRLLGYSTAIGPVEKKLNNILKNLLDITLDACVNIMRLMLIYNV